MKVFSVKLKNAGGLFLLVCGLATMSFAQSPMKSSTPTLVMPGMRENMPIATGNNLNCAGYIQKAPVNTTFEIVGADKEKEKYTYAQGDYVYVNRGASRGARVGEVLAITRPRGQFESEFSRKEGKLGIYVEEVGTMEIVRVKEDVSVARINYSCQNVLLGDLVQTNTVRVSPTFQARPALDAFGEPSGKQMGRIVLSRDGKEYLSRDNIVYIDLGAEDNVQVGDYLTIFRSLGEGNPLRPYDDVPLNNSSGDYGSKEYKGTRYSNQASRKARSEADGKLVRTSDAKKGRQSNLREVVGEMVILNVKERTATAVITRGISEIHTGDMVEVQ